MVNSDITKYKEFILQFSHECLMFSEKAVKGYSEFKNTCVSLQFMNQAFQSIKIAQSFYMQNFEHGTIQCFEDFSHQFMLLNQEFLRALQVQYGLQYSYIELENLEKIFGELKELFNC